MSDKVKETKTVEQLETEIVGLKVRIARLESFMRGFPDPNEYIKPYMFTAESAEEKNMIEEAITVVRQYDRASASLLQRRLSIGYARAARLIDILETKKIIAPSDGSSKPREVYKENKQKRKILKK